LESSIVYELSAVRVLLTIKVEVAAKLDVNSGKIISLFKFLTVSAESELKSSDMLGSGKENDYMTG
jgi:hypothetical protein